jgi:hypothetical protein
MANLVFDQYNVTVKRGATIISPYDNLIVAPGVGGGAFDVSFGLRLRVGAYAVTVDAYKNGVKAATATTPLTVASSGA